MPPVEGKHQILQCLVQGQGSQSQSREGRALRTTCLNEFDEPKKSESDDCESSNSFTRPVPCAQPESFTCAECGKGFFSAAALIHHHFIHKSENPEEEVAHKTKVSTDFTSTQQQRADPTSESKRIYTVKALNGFTVQERVFVDTPQHVEQYIPRCQE
ncbi:hypothetical protein NDU88_007572 [Pleurodeles waltl]|uniref:C2H2-type domain-containing protein n=1 Tax=Pleurodeles waltl TaxID=8319 RepID=A0AAV7WJ18_PLEWA|nr:hypothetical protein NDU88_007572 [Pleurodeles waltl]